MRIKKYIMARNHGHDYSLLPYNLHMINTYNPLKYGFAC